MLASKNAKVPGVGGLVPLVAVTVALMVTGLPKLAGPPVGGLTESPTGAIGDVTLVPCEMEPMKFPAPE